MDTLMLSPVCALCVSTAWSPGPQSCQLSPAGLLSGQHVPPTGLPLGKSLLNPTRDPGTRKVVLENAACLLVPVMCTFTQEGLYGNLCAGLCAQSWQPSFAGDNSKPGDGEVSRTLTNGLCHEGNERSCTEYLGGRVFTLGAGKQGWLLPSSCRAPSPPFSPGIPGKASLDSNRHPALCGGDCALPQTP